MNRIPSSLSYTWTWSSLSILLDLHLVYTQHSCLFSQPWTVFCHFIDKIQIKRKCLFLVPVRATSVGISKICLSHLLVSKMSSPSTISPLLLISSHPPTPFTTSIQLIMSISVTFTLQWCEQRLLSGQLDDSNFTFTDCVTISSFFSSLSLLLVVLCKDNYS